MRFEFGKNWTSFLESIDESRIAASTASLSTMLDTTRLDNLTFLDVGCGSGLGSLSAWRMGATVHSFDFDPASVACTQELRRRFAEPSRWTVEQGSALDEAYLQRLGLFDIVYSWGVLHHTGNMKRAIELTADRVKADGRLFIAIYNDQGSASRRWSTIKQIYHRLPERLQPAWVGAVASVHEAKFAAARLARGRNPLPTADWKQKAHDRGMSPWHDWVDWVGGWPFEVARPDEIINPLIARGFRLERLKTVGNGWGCNEYVFRREGSR
ncbi:MAG: class I SAM-dependent methyltransferase [Planctomycetaceae bacterium]